MSSSLCIDHKAYGRLLQWTDTCEGIHYPRGGFHQVPQTMTNIAESQPIPAKFHFGKAVERVTYDSTGRATGIVLANGERKEADAVVVNADLVWAHNNLFKKDQEKVSEEKLNPALAKKLLNKPHSYVNDHILLVRS